MRRVHIASQEAQVGPVVRQRCVWCGELLHEVDLNNIAVHPPPENPNDIGKGWEPGALVFIEGTNPTSLGVVEHNDGDQVPSGFCGDEGPRIRLVEPATEAP